MINFIESKLIAFKALSEIAGVSILNEAQKSLLQFSSKIEIWAVSTTIAGRNGYREIIILHIWIKQDFPLTIPNIFVSPFDYDRLKYIPHIDSNRLICTFNSENSRPDPSNPAGIIIESVLKAKRIIEDGLSGISVNDFEKEFIAYWDNCYGPKDKIYNNVLCLIDGVPLNDKLSLIILKKSFSGISFVLHQSDDIANRFKKFLEDYKFEYSESESLFIGNLGIKYSPPFDICNYDVEKLILQLGVAKYNLYKEYVNSSINPKLITFIVNPVDSIHIIGFFHQQLVTKRNGFRPDSLSPFMVLKTFQARDNAYRVLPKVYTPSRLLKRTQGLNRNIKEMKFLVAGLGSIGSNLIFYLNSFNYPEFRLIDWDDLEIENIKRHFLGFSFIGKKKTIAIQEYLRKNEPIQQVSTRENSIINICNEDIGYINEVDYIFLATGKTNIDKWITDAMISGIIKKPVFVIWVEPYLLGGHCIYINPESKPYSTFFDNDDFFLYNVIDKSEYQNGNEKLTLHEAGCQSTYIPYSSLNVVSFLSSIFPQISNIITNNINESQAFSWIGNLSISKELNIKLSDFSSTKASTTLILHN